MNRKDNKFGYSLKNSEVLQGIQGGTKEIKKRFCDIRNSLI